jgi:hypothetical protein
MMAKKKTETPKPTRNRQSGGFAIFKVYDQAAGTPAPEDRQYQMIVDNLNNQLDCERWLKENAEQLEESTEYVIAQIKKTVKVKVQTIKKVTVS